MIRSAPEEYPAAVVGETAETVLSAQGLTKEFVTKGRPAVAALAGVSLEVRAGRVTGLVGADGAGKTTLLRIAAGLLIPGAGRMQVLGMDVVDQALEIQSLVGYMPQRFGLYQDLTVLENLSLYGDLQGVPTSERRSRYDELLEMTDLGRYTGRRAGALSGGMKQKLGLACALIKSPQLLLLDEPTVGVDPVSRRELWKIVYRLVERQGIGVLLSTAYLDEAERCSRVVVLHQGRVLEEGSPEEFRQRLGNRVALVAPRGQEKPRQLYTDLAGRPGLVDVTIRSGNVRTVFEVEPGDDPAAFLGEYGNRAESVPATFEDAFMALIPRHDGEPGAPAALSAAAAPPREGAGAAEEAVTARELVKRFGDFVAVKKLSFSVGRGEIFGLLGPNGAGKSTTFRMLCGLLPASSGEIRVAGQDLRHSRARARSRLGYMAQQFSLYRQLTVLENLRFFGTAYGLDRRALRRRLQWAFEEFDLGSWRDKAADSLPGGYKQRLAMAAALLHEPEILFLDEPTSGVDPFARREFWLRINGFAEQGVAVVVTTHFMEEAEYCDRMLIMSQGDTLAIGTPDEIRKRACSDQNVEPTMDDAFIALAEGAAVATGSGGPAGAGRQGGR